MGTEREGEWTVAADVWGDDLGVVLDHDEARKILLARMGFRGSLDSYTNRQKGWVAADVWKPLVDRLIKTIPDEMRTEQVIRQVDIRSLLHQVMNTEYGAQQAGEITVNGQKFSPNMQALAGAIFVDYQTEMRGQLETQLLDSGVSADEAPMFTADLMSQWRDQAPFTLFPTQAVEGAILRDPTTGQVSTVGANENLSDIGSQIANVLNGSGTRPEAPAFLTQRDLAIMLATDTPGSVFGRYGDDLSMRAAFETQGGIAPRDQTNVDLGELSPNARSRPSRPDTSNLAGIAGASDDYGRRYTLRQAMELPLGMTREQIASLTDKMEKAGLFAQVEGGTPAVKGDPTDPQFKRAYQLLLAKSIERGVAVPSVLEQDRLAYDEAVQDAVRTRLTDPARIRIAADTIARDQLGRRLSKSELTKYVAAIHQMEKGQAATESDDDGGDVTEVDYASRIEEMIRQQNPGEAGAADTVDQYEMFRSILAGPGRGVA